MIKDNLILKVRNELKTHADEKTKGSFQRFFKEEVKFHGVKSAVVVKIAKDNFQEVQKLDKKEVFKLSETLLASGYCEEAWIAANWVHWYNHRQEKDIAIYEHWINNFIDNWAECDTFCNHTVGAFIEKFPKYLQKLKKWATSQNLWLRRAAAVSLIIPARKGKYLKDIFEIADLLLTDPKDMVQKGYGWMLKEASRKHQKEVFDYVMKNKKIMPRTALRYAIEKMPQDLRKKAMEK
jgi:3-methyladenine DNA glycosylase AlkD